MHITDIMQRESPTFSFEFFPPKTPAAAEILYQTIRDLESYMPHFVSVTYGAGGSTRNLTHDLVERIQHTTKLDPIPHLTCVCHNEEEVEEILLRYARSRIGNILALGGDRPRDIAYDKSRDSFQHAIDLVKFIRRFNDSGAHPERRGFIDHFRKSVVSSALLYASQSKITGVAMTERAGSGNLHRTLSGVSA